MTQKRTIDGNIISNFYKKTLALKHIELENNNKNLRLFSEDISEDNKKCFFACTYTDLFNLCVGNTRHYYENIEKGQEVKLHFDIDYKLNSHNNENKDELIEKFINETIELVNKKLNEYNI